MENALYYTFSTIAQSLAAIMGLLGAVALFRLQTVESELRERGSRILLSVNGADEATTYAYTYGRFEEFIKCLDQFIEGREKASLTIRFGLSERADIQGVRVLAPVRSSIVSLAKFSFAISGITMVGSVLALCLVPSITNAQWNGMPLRLGPTCLGLGLVAFTVCLIFDARLMFKLISR